jgi:DNA-binding Lrp family transcriptional regulator
MVIGITMIKVAPDHEKESYDALMRIESVREVYRLFGEFNFFLMLEASDQAGLRQILEDIRDLIYVKDAWPLLVSRDESLSEVEMAFSHERELAAS